MGLSYLAKNPEGERWLITPEKTDYETEEPTGAAAAYQTSIDAYTAGGGKDATELASFATIKAAFLKTDNDNKTKNEDNDTLNKANIKKK